MPPRVSDLLGDDALGLVVLAGSDSLDRTIRWVATSEHEDPTSFLEGGELLLLTGLRLPRSRQALASYVQRLGDAGVVGLGYGVGLVRQRTPAALVEACRGVGLVLVEIPESTPFVAVSKKVSDLLAADEVAEMAWANRAQQDLTRAAVHDGVQPVLRKVARLLDSWVAVLDTDGYPVHVHPRSAEPRLRRSAGELERLRARGLAATSLVVGDDHLSVHQLVTRSAGKGQLVIGSRAGLTSPQRSLVTVAAALLSLERDVALDRNAGRRSSAVLDLARRGVVTDRETLEVLGCPVMALPTLWAVTVDGSDTAMAAWLDGLSSLGPERVVSAPDGRVVRVVLGWEPDLELVRSLSGTGAGVRLGAAGPACEPAELEMLFERSDRALCWARERGLAWATYEDTVQGLSALATPEDALAFAQEMVAPLRQYARSTGNELEHTLAVWLRHHGVFEPAAAELGVHRHTLRNRVARAESLLGQDLGDTDVRMSLWFALCTLQSV